MRLHYTAGAAQTPRALKVCLSMLAFMRKFAKSWFAALLFAPLLIGFAVFGVNRDLFAVGASSNVVEVGERKVSAFDFKRQFDDYRKQLEQRFQRPIGMDVVKEQNLDHRMLEELAFQESLDELLTRIGLRASDKLFNDRLRQVPAFFDSVTGEFDPNKYAQALAERQLTPAIFKAAITDEMRRNQFIASAVAGMHAPRAYSAIGGLFALEQRDLAYFVIDPRTIGPVAPPTDAEVNAFIKQNANQWILPEFRAFTVVRFNAKDYEAGVTVTEAEIQKQFDFLKDTYSRPEVRSVVQIAAKDAAQATAIAARLNKGEAPAAVAKSVGATAVNYDGKPRTAFFDPAIAAAAFSLPQGGVSGPVKGKLGLVVLKVSSITAGQTATLAEHRQEIVAKIRKDLAAGKISEMSKVYEDAHELGSPLAASAAKAGAPVATYAPVTADGRGQDGKPVAGISPQVLKAAFEQAQGGESDIQEAGEGEYFAVRVDRIVPPAMPPMNLVRPQVIRNLTLRKTADQMRVRAEALLARVRKGEGLDAVAASAGATVVRVNAISRMTVQAHEALGRELLGATLGSRKGEPFTAASGFGVVVGVVTAVRTGDPQQVAMATEQGRQQFTQELYGDTLEAARGYARTKLKTRVNLTLARQALGINTDEAEDAPAGKGQ